LLWLRHWTMQARRGENMTSQERTDRVAGGGSPAGGENGETGPARLR
jgi:hypothetical protein